MELSDLSTIVVETSNLASHYFVLRKEMSYTVYSASESLLIASSSIEPYTSTITKNGLNTFGVLNYPPTVEGSWSTEFDCTLNDGPARCDDL